MQTLEPILAGRPFLAGLSDHYLRLLVGHAANE